MKRTKAPPHRAELLASLQQHPLVLVLPHSVTRLDLSCKQKVVLCILMTWETASQQTENNYTHTHRGTGNIPTHPWKRPWSAFLHKSGYHITHQMTQPEKGFLPGHNRVSSLREETVSSDDSMAVALPSNILPEHKRSLDWLKQPWENPFRKFCGSHVFKRSLKFFF